MSITHWDDVEKHRAARGPMSAHWQDLGTPAGTYRCGVQRIIMEPGEQPTPAHVHGEAEEIFFVLGGSGLTWMDGKAYELREGDCIVYKNFHEAHTLRGGDNGLEVLAFGAREYMPAGALPRAGVIWGIAGVIEETPLDELHPWDREPAIEWPKAEPERPPTIVNASEVEPDIRGGRRRRDLARAAGSRWTGLKHIECDAATLSVAPHCHSAEEEIFVVLGGEGTLELLGDKLETSRVRRGSIVARPPGTGVAHTFRAGDSGLTLLAWGTREPNDITWYPRSKKLFWAGVNIIGRIEPLDYWDGEELV